MSVMQTKCKGCGADIIFVPNVVTGKAMPLNVVRENRIVLVDNGGYPGAKPDDITARARVVDTYTSHFADCPQADSFRRIA